MFRGPTALLYILFEMISETMSIATIHDVQKMAMFSCSPKFLVARTDSIVFKMEVAGNNSEYLLSGRHRPQFFKRRIASSAEVCSPFHKDTGACKTANPSGPCTCRRLAPDIYKLTYKLKVMLDDSHAKVYLLWTSDSEYLDSTYIIPEVRALKKLVYESTHDCSSTYLVAGLDSTVLKFELSGFDVRYTEEAGHSAKIFLSDEDGVTELCGGFGFNCSLRALDSCTCERTGEHKYIITFRDTINKTGELYLFWPGTPGVTSHSYPLPEIRDVCPSPDGVSTHLYLAITGLVLFSGMICLICCFFGRMREKEEGPQSLRELRDLRSSQTLATSVSNVPKIQIHPPPNNPSRVVSFTSVTSAESESTLTSTAWSSTTGSSYD